LAFLDLEGDVPTSGEVSDPGGDLTEWKEDVEPEEVGVTSEALHTGTSGALMSTEDWRMGLDIWRPRRLTGGCCCCWLADEGLGESRLWMVEDEAVEVGETLLSSTDGVLATLENLDLSLDESPPPPPLPDLSSVEPSTSLMAFLSGSPSSSMWQMRASEKRALGCSTVDHLGVKVALGAGGDMEATVGCCWADGLTSAGGGATAPLMLEVRAADAKVADTEVVDDEEEVVVEF